MRMSIEELVVKEDKTVKEFIDELKLASPLLLEMNGDIFYPDENPAKILKGGDIVTLIPIIAGG